MCEEQIFVLQKAELYESYPHLPERGGRAVQPGAQPCRYTSTTISPMQSTTVTQLCCSWLWRKLAWSQSWYVHYATQTYPGATGNRLKQPGCIWNDWDDFLTMAHSRQAETVSPQTPVPESLCVIKHFRQGVNSHLSFSLVLLQFCPGAICSFLEGSLQKYQRPFTSKDGEEEEHHMAFPKCVHTTCLLRVYISWPWSEPNLRLTLNLAN